MKLTPEERSEVTKQLLVVGQLFGLRGKLNPDLLMKWMSSEDVDPDFRYQKQVLAAIRFRDDV